MRMEGAEFLTASTWGHPPRARSSARAQTGKEGQRRKLRGQRAKKFWLPFSQPRKPGAKGALATLPTRRRRDRPDDARATYDYRPQRTFAFQSGLRSEALSIKQRLGRGQRASPSTFHISRARQSQALQVERRLVASARGGRNARVSTRPVHTACEARAFREVEAVAWPRQRASATAPRLSHVVLTREASVRESLQPQ